MTPAPRLILLNGMPAVGKTTLARRYAEDHPLALVLDIDSVRRMLGRWRDDATAAGLAARALTVAMARAHLGAGHDVVVPQYLGRPAFIVELAEVAEQSGAFFHEIVLTDDRETLLRRFTERTARADEQVHVDAGAQIAALGGVTALAAMHDRLLLVLNSRTGAVVLHNPDGALEPTYGRLVAALGAEPAPRQSSDEER